MTGVALIGYGYWGQKLHRYLKENAGFSLRAVHFPSLAKLSVAEIQEKYGAGFTPDLQSIWKDPAIQAVVIATPIGTHFDVAREALRHGKHVMVEKPLSLSLAECEELRTLARSKKLKLHTEYTYTFSDALRFASKLCAEGQLGKIQSVSVAIRQLGRFVPYDILALLGSHAFSILDQFVPIRALALQLHPQLITDGRVTGALVTFRSAGLSGFLEVTAHASAREKKLIVYGEKGTLIFDPSSKDTVVTTWYSRTPGLRENELVLKREAHSFDENNNLKNAVQDFFEVVAHNKPDNLDRAIDITAALERCHQGSHD